MEKDKIKIVRKNIKAANIKVTPALDVLLCAPIDMSEERISSIIDKRASWIDEKLAFFRAAAQSEKEYISGENAIYLGRQYRLKIIEDNTGIVKMNGRYIEIRVPDKTDTSKKRELLKKWYKTRAAAYFKKILVKFVKAANVKINMVTVKYMKTRWGSCNSAKGYINLNAELVKQPIYAIEYVILHELAHLIHDNHSKNFYRFLDTHMPDWQERKKRLTPLKG